MAGPAAAAGGWEISGDIVFADTYVGDTSAPSTITITNGTGAAADPAVTFTPYGSANGSIAASTDCPGLLEPLASCSITATFTPVSAGFFNGSLDTRVDGLQYLINADGTGLSPFSVSPESITATTTPVGSVSAPLSLSITNVSGTARPLTYSTRGPSLAQVPTPEWVATDSCGSSLAAGASCTISFVFAPTSIGAHQSQFMIDDLAGDPTHIINLQGTGSPWYSVSTTTINFGRVAIGVSKFGTLELTNISSTAHNPSAFMSNVTNPQIGFTNNCGTGTLQPGASCTVTFSLTGATAGAVGVDAIFTVGGEPHPLRLEANVVAFLAPSAGLSGGAAVEGTPITLTYVPPFMGSDEPYSYSYDFEDDGIFEVTDSAFSSFEFPASLSADNGTIAIGTRITGSSGAYAQTFLLIDIANIAPTAWITGPTTGIAGTPLTLEVGADDPSPVDAAGLFDYTVDWGDAGVASTLSGPADPPVSHTFTKPGTYTISATATDKDGGMSLATTHSVTIAAAAAPSVVKITPPGQQRASGGVSPRTLPRTGLDSTEPFGFGALCLLLLGVAGVTATGSRTRRRLHR